MRKVVVNKQLYLPSLEKTEQSLLYRWYIASICVSQNINSHPLTRNIELLRRARLDKYVEAGIELVQAVLVIYSDNKNIGRNEGDFFFK